MPQLRSVPNARLTLLLSPATWRRAFKRKTSGTESACSSALVRICWSKWSWYIASIRSFFLLPTSTVLDQGRGLFLLARLARANSGFRSAGTGGVSSPPLAVFTPFGEGRLRGKTGRMALRPRGLERGGAGHYRGRVL